MSGIRSTDRRVYTAPVLEECSRHTMPTEKRPQQQQQYTPLLFIQGDLYNNALSEIDRRRGRDKAGRPWPFVPRRLGPLHAALFY